MSTRIMSVRASCEGRGLRAGHRPAYLECDRVARLVIGSIGLLAGDGESTVTSLLSCLARFDGVALSVM
jgi:hypothetical protein